MRSWHFTLPAAHHLQGNGSLDDPRYACFTVFAKDKPVMVVYIIFYVCQLVALWCTLCIIMSQTSVFVVYFILYGFGCNSIMVQTCL